MNEHDQSQKTEHLNLMLEFFSKKEQKEINLTKKLEKVEQENASLQTQLSTHRETLAASTQDLRSYQSRLGKLEQTVGEHRREIAELRERLPVFCHKSHLRCSLRHLEMCPYLCIEAKWPLCLQ